MPFEPDRPPGTASDARPDEQEEAAVATVLRGAEGSWPRHAPAAKERVRAHWRAAIAARRRRRVALAAAVAALIAAGFLGVVLARRYAVAPAGAAPGERLFATVERIVSLDEAGAGAPLLRVGERAAAVGEAVSANQSVETSPRALAALRAGRTSIRLDAATRLRVLSPSRIELERGAVYLDTPPGAEDGVAGFEVVAAAGAVRELGTQFEVRVDGGDLRVRVREGAVEFAGGAGTRRVEERQELWSPAGGRLTLREAPAAGPDWAWVARAAPQPALEGRSLAELLAWVGRETGSTIVFADERDSALVEGVLLHGPLEELDPVSAVAVVLPTCGLRGRFEGERLLISRR